MEDLVCNEQGCEMVFADIASFEDHYSLAHSHQCAVCGKKFASSYFLELHSDENHCPFFKLRQEKDPSAAHFKCLSAACSQTFNKKEDRDDHASKAHNIRDLEILLEKRKMAKRVEDLEQRMQAISVGKKTRAADTKVQFGDDQQRVFDMPPPSLKAKRRNNK